MSESTRGRLLVATPDLEDPNFFRTVVLVLEHTSDGAVGVVLNRPSPGTAVGASLPAWAALATEPPVVFVGGPVQPEAAIGLARRHDQAEPDGFAPLFDDLGTVDLERDPEQVLPRVDRLRVFAGYAGWGPTQLEAELDAGGWFVLPAEPSDPWSAAPEGMWRAVLRRQRGKERLFADFPLDAKLN
ncbi:MAG TPA: YqgE/AlgH family protein [Acidimicrobiia bacterium]|nr:YqgE/AlgH family protein [Acidimicrobiia bacterium]